MKILRRYWILITIIFIAFFLRFWQLGQIPVNPDWDEVALGYNAYSILKTGRDEYGTFLPAVLRSYDDYKPPLYAYLAIPSVAVFGLNTWAVRLPSAIAGVLAVLGTYFLVRKLYKNHNGYKKYNFYISLLAAALLAISPWHIQFSRIAFEANIGLTLNIWGVYLFLKGLERGVWLKLSAIIFGLALYAYHSERIFAPLLVLVLALLNRRQLLAKKKEVFTVALIGMIVVLPLIPVVFNESSWLRLSGTSSLADKTGLLMRSAAKLVDDQASGNYLGLVFDNRRLIYAKTLLDGYLSHFSFRWLFLTGDNDRHHAPDMGLLYLWELPFLLIGMFVVWRRGGKLAKLLFAWFFIAPLAASPTSETPHAIRTLVFLPTFQIFTAAGITSTISNIKYQISNSNTDYKKYVVLFASFFYILFLIFNISYYIHMYFTHMNYEFSKFWQYGYKETVEFAAMHRSEYEKIVVSTSLEQPHMFFLFYLKYDPAKYLAEGGTASGGFEEWRNKFDIFEFRPIDWKFEKKDGKTLFIGAPRDLPDPTIKTIFYLNGQDAIKIRT